MIPEMVQGEIARLDTKFKVQLDPLQVEGATTIRIICRLDDLNLPSVPPIEIAIPNAYPEKPPVCTFDDDEYRASTFLNTTKNIFDQNVSKLAKQHSVTSLLQTWVRFVAIRCLTCSTCHLHACLFCRNQVCGKPLIKIACLSLNLSLHNFELCIKTCFRRV